MSNGGELALLSLKDKWARTAIDLDVNFPMLAQFVQREGTWEADAFHVNSAI